MDERKKKVSFNPSTSEFLIGVGSNDSAASDVPSQSQRRGQTRTIQSSAFASLGVIEMPKPGTQGDRCVGCFLSICNI
jgi:hypothetical protein